MKQRPLELLAQADLFQLLGRLFALPTPAIRDRLDYAAEDLVALVQATGLPRPELLAQALQETCVLAARGATEDWAAEHTRLFECAVICPINETAYIRRDKGAILADVAGFYRAFGLRVSDESHEKHDHLVCQLEFVSLLLVLAARALKNQDQEPTEVTENALRSFAVEHLGEWLPGFCKRLAETTQSPLFANAGALLSEVWRSFCERHDYSVSTGKVLVCAEDESTPYECGMADDGKC